MRKLVSLFVALFNVLRAVDSKAFYFALFMSAYNLVLMFIRIEQRDLANTIFSGVCLALCFGSAVYIFRLKLYQARAKKPFPKYEDNV